MDSAPSSPSRKALESTAQNEGAPSSPSSKSLESTTRPETTPPLLPPEPLLSPEEHAAASKRLEDLLLAFRAARSKMGSKLRLRLIASRRAASRPAPDQPTLDALPGITEPSIRVIDPEVIRQNPELLDVLREVSTTFGSLSPNVLFFCIQGTEADLTGTRDVSEAEVDSLQEALFEAEDTSSDSEESEAEVSDETLFTAGSTIEQELHNIQEEADKERSGAISEKAPSKEASPTEAPSTEASPKEAPPAEASPAEAPPAEAPPAEAPPAEASSSEAASSQASGTQAPSSQVAGEIPRLSDFDFTMQHFKENFEIKSIDQLREHHKRVKNMTDLPVPATNLADPEPQVFSKDTVLPESKLVALTSFNTESPTERVFKTAASGKVANWGNVEEGINVTVDSDVGHMSKADTGAGTSRYYSIMVRYVNLLHAPALRVIVAFSDGSPTIGSYFHHAYVEFPWNPMYGAFGFVGEPQVTTNLGHYDPKGKHHQLSSQTIEFHTQRVTSSGLFPPQDTMDRITGGLGDRDLSEPLDIMRRLTNASTSQAIHVKLSYRLRMPSKLNEENEKKKGRAPVYKISPVWLAMQRMSPGGCGIPQFGPAPFMLPSFQTAFDLRTFRLASNGRAHIDQDAFLSPLNAMKFSVPRPMITFHTDDVFRHIDDAVLQMANYIHYGHLEESISIRGFNAGKHLGILFTVKQLLVLAVKFDGDYYKINRNLAGDELEHRICGNQRLKVSWVKPTGEHDEEQPAFSFEGMVAPFAVEDTVPADFYVLALNKKPSDFSGQPTELRDAIRTGNAKQASGLQLKLTLPDRDDQYSMAIEVVKDLKKATEFHDMLLGQDMSNVPTRNMLTSMLDSQSPTFAADRAAAEQALDDLIAKGTGSSPWEAEQQVFLQSVRNAKGSTIIGSGCAGTGKTTVALALVHMFHSLGYRIEAFSPTNAGADMLAESAHAKFGGQVKVIRDYPHSGDESPFRGFEPREKPTWHGQVTEDDVVQFATFELLATAIHDLDTLKASAKELSLQHRVLEQARIRDRNSDAALNLWVFLPNESTPVNAWSILAQLVHDIGQDDFEWSDATKARYFAAYKVCRQHMMALNTFNVTTLGNSRNKDLVEFFGRDEAHVKAKVHADGDAPLGLPASRGTIIVIDEAFKEKEPTTWSPLVSLARRGRIAGIIMVGDMRQLDPLNLPSKMFNPFHGIGEQSLPARLIANGFAVTEFLVQNRAPLAISDFPSLRFYGGRLRTSQEMTTITMEDQWPGLADVLKDSVFAARDASTVTDTQLRVHWVEMPGERRSSDTTQSKVVVEFAVWWLTRMWLPMYILCKDSPTPRKMRDVVAVECGYAETRQWWHQRIVKTLREYNADKPREEHVSFDDFPELVSGDASQGREWDFVVIDAAITDGENLGHMRKEGRVNTYLTRPKVCLQILGGTCKHKDLNGNINSPAPALAVLHARLAHPDREAVLLMEDCGFSAYGVDGVNENDPILVAGDEIPASLGGARPTTAAYDVVQEIVTASEGTADLPTRIPLRAIANADAGWDAGTNTGGTDGDAGFQADGGEDGSAGTGFQEDSGTDNWGNQPPAGHDNAGDASGGDGESSLPAQDANDSKESGDPVPSPARPAEILEDDENNEQATAPAESKATDAGNGFNWTGPQAVVAQATEPAEQKPDEATEPAEQKHDEATEPAESKATDAGNEFNWTGPQAVVAQAPWDDRPTEIDKGWVEPSNSQIRKAKNKGAARRRRNSDLGAGDSQQQDHDSDDDAKPLDHEL